MARTPETLPADYGGPSQEGCAEAECAVTFLHLVDMLRDVTGFDGYFEPLKADGTPLSVRWLTPLTSFASVPNEVRTDLRARYVERPGFDSVTECGATCYCAIDPDVPATKTGREARTIDVTLHGVRPVRVQLADKSDAAVRAAEARIAKFGVFDAKMGRRILPEEVDGITDMRTFCSPTECYVLLNTRVRVFGKLTATFDILRKFGTCTPFPWTVLDDGAPPFLTDHDF